MDTDRAALEAGASTAHLKQAWALWDAGEKLGLSGLFAKARRQACCGVFGSRCDCSNPQCGRRYFRRFRCKNRYCPDCGRVIYNELFRRYMGLSPVVEAFLAEDRIRLVCKMDFTVVNLRRLPTGAEVRSFNSAIKKFYRALVRALGLSPRECGLLYCDEFGGGENSNLHSHGTYVGPPIPHSWFGKGGRLAEMWRRACEGTVFAGSFIISVKLAGGFPRALAHSLKYTGKFLDSDPVRLASLEAAFCGVKRIHVLGLLYNKLSKEDPPELACPECEFPLVQERRWVPVKFLAAAGRVDLDVARQDSRRRRGLGTNRNNYAAGGARRPPWP